MTVFAQEQYAFPGCPRTYYRVGERNWVEFKNSDGAVSRTYYDATSWGRSLTIDKEAYDIPPYDINVTENAKWFGEAVEKARKSGRMTPTQCRWLAFTVSVLFIVLLIPISLYCAFSPKGRHDVRAMLADLKTLWSGKEPTALRLED